MPATMTRSASRPAAAVATAPLIRLQSLQSLTLGLLLMASLTASWPNRIKTLHVCNDLHVTHPGQSAEMGVGNVSLVLLKGDEEVNCFEPGQEYSVELRSNYIEMMGVLWMLDPVKGEFPRGPEPRNTKFNTPCSQPSVSHFCEDQTDLSGCILGSNGMSLKVGYLAPSDDASSLVMFRYTVVFKADKFVENEKKSFERCPAQPSFPTNTNNSTISEVLPPCPPENGSSQPQPNDNNLTSLNNNNNPTIDSQSEPRCDTFKPKNHSSPVSGNCGIERRRSNESRTYTQKGIDYNCVIKVSTQYSRKVTCEPRCDKSGEPVICRVKNNSERSRNFLCTPTSDFPEAEPIESIALKVTQQSKCECYKLSDVDVSCSTSNPSPRCQPRTTTTEATPTTPPPSLNRP